MNAQNHPHLYIRAKTLDEAFSRFEPGLPLPPDSPFYVTREDNPLGRIKRRLLSPPQQTRKLFWTGHRGCGKSTELNRLAADPDVLANYWPVKFSVMQELDINALTHVEILLAIGAQIYQQYTGAGHRLSDDLLDELNRWQHTTVIHLQEKGAIFESGAGFDIGKFLAVALLKLKTEHATREAARQEIGPQISRLIELINLICAEIQIQQGRAVLVIIEDLDKPPLLITRPLFEESLANLLQPNCAIVYTVPVALFFDPAYARIQREGEAFLLPNIKLHPKKQPDTPRSDGYKIMRHMALARMDDALITSDALDLVVRLSGGVFREMALLMQRSLDNALAQNRPQVEVSHVNSAAGQRRSEFRRILTDEQYCLLLEVAATNEMRHPEKLADLFHLLAALEYANAETWCDVHPVLRPLLAEIEPHIDCNESEA